MEKIQANLVFEILGKPADHVKEALNTLVVRIGSEKGIKVLEKKYHEPKAIEKSPLFTAFAEVSLGFDSLDTYFALVFAYLPSHAEIIHPEKITLQSSHLNDLASKISARMHQYDDIVKKVVADRDFFVRKLYEAAPQMFKQMPPDLKKSLEEEKQMQDQNSTVASKNTPKKSKSKPKKK